LRARSSDHEIVGSSVSLLHPERASHPAGLVFAHAASKDHRLVMRLYGFVTQDRTIRVAAEVHPVSVHGTLEPQWLVNDFETHRHARAFVEETLCALEHLGCIVVEIDDDAVPGGLAGLPAKARHP
jgi:hypothetical protein